VVVSSSSRHTTTGTAVVALVVAAAGILTGLSMAWAQQGAPAPAITIEAFQFKPRDLDTQVDVRVTWMNDDDVTHTATSGTPERRTDLFNAALNGKGARFEFTFAKTGTYEYFCARHPHMRGSITIR